MSEVDAFTGARIFDGDRWHDGAALIVADGKVEAIATQAPSGATEIRLDGGLLVPGFVDLQVNGGGGVLLNEAPTLQGIRTICAAHAPYGTTALLPTLITDTAPVTERAIGAGIEAQRDGVPGFLGLHLEGPHLSVARKGAHDPTLIRPMDEADLTRLHHAAEQLPTLIVTVAAETVTPQQVAALAGAGVIVSIGHSEAGISAVRAATDAGATMVTHLFNAMSQLGNREPGVVGAALSDGRLHAGLIADGIHVLSETIGVALRAKAGPARIFLVTDAMSVTGTDMAEITLNGRTIYRANGALRLADGTLAGADLTMIEAVVLMYRRVGVALEEALRMASLYPAQAIGRDQQHGHLRPGAVGNFVHLSDELEVAGTWIGGKPVFRAERE